MGVNIYEPHWKFVYDGEDITHKVVNFNMTWSKNRPASVKLTTPRGALTFGMDKELQVYLNGREVFRGRAKIQKRMKTVDYIYFYDLLLALSKHYLKKAYENESLHDIITDSIQSFMSDENITDYTLDIDDTDAFALTTTISLAPKDLLKIYTTFANITGGRFYLSYEGGKYNFHFNAPAEHELTSWVDRQLGVDYKKLCNIVMVLGLEVDDIKMFKIVKDDESINTYGKIYCQPINTNLKDYDLLQYVGEKHLSKYAQPLHSGFVILPGDIIPPGDKVYFSDDSNKYEIKNIRINFDGLVQISAEENAGIIDRQLELELAAYELAILEKGYIETDISASKYGGLLGSWTYDLSACTSSCLSSCQTVCETDCLGPCLGGCMVTCQLWCQSLYEINEVI